MSVYIWKSPSTQYRRDKVVLRITCIKNVKFKIINARTGQYVCYFYYSEYLNWATQNFRLGGYSCSFRSRCIFVTKLIASVMLRITSIIQDSTFCTFTSRSKYSRFFLHNHPGYYGKNLSQSFLTGGKFPT